MVKNKLLQAKSFVAFEGAIYAAHRVLIDLKELLRNATEPERAKMEAVRTYEGQMKNALEEAIRHGDAWASQIKDGVKSTSS